MGLFCTTGHGSYAKIVIISYDILYRNIIVYCLSTDCCYAAVLVPNDFNFNTMPSKITKILVFA